MMHVNKTIIVNQIRHLCFLHRLRTSDHHIAKHLHVYFHLYWAICLYTLCYLQTKTCIVLIYQFFRSCLLSYDIKILSTSFQDLLFLACSHPDNRTTITSIAEWPEWILEVLISNHEVSVASLLFYFLMRIMFR